VAVLLRHWAANDNPEFRASFVATKPIQGVPISVTGVPTTDPSGRLPPPIEADFGRLAVTGIKTDSDRETVLIDITVAPADCPGLLKRLGGRCGDRSAPARDSGEVELSAVRAGDLMSADFWLADPGTVHLAESGGLTKQGVPTAWALESDGPTTRVNVFCGESMLLISAHLTQHVRCAYGGAHYTLPISSKEAVLPSLFLTDVSSLNANLKGSSASMKVGEGELSRDGEFETLASAEPLEVSMKGSDHHPVDLATHSQTESGTFSLAMSAGWARGIEWEGEDHTRSRLDRQPELAYALFGVVAGFFLIAFTDFGFALFTLREVS
jgi:hypothetical protein